MERYIGLDVHAASCTAAVIDARGKRVSGPHVLETNGQVLVEFIKIQPGRVHLCLEEGTQSTWLAEILGPHVAEVVVAHISESRGPKDDARDALTLAERLRTHAIETKVYKQTGPFASLRQLTKIHTMVVQDTVRTQNRIKALFRSRGVAVTGKAVYRVAERTDWLSKLPDSSRGAANVLFAQYDALCEVRNQSQKNLTVESHHHPITKVLETCPGLGGIRVAQLVSIVVTPERFRTRQQFWSYCGLGIVMRSSSDWKQTTKGQWERAQVQKTRGLNFNHNHTLKEIFKGAATTVVAQHPNDPLHKDYERMLAAGTKPNLAKLTLARKLASIALAMWKRKEVYDPAKYVKPISSLVSVRAMARSHPVRRTVRVARPGRVGFEGEHPLGFWTRFTARSPKSSPKSPRIGYAPSEDRTKPWHNDALIAGWFPHFSRENRAASKTAGLRTRCELRRTQGHTSARAAPSQ